MLLIAWESYALDRHKWTNLVDDVSKLLTVGEYVLAGGASTELEELISGEKESFKKSETGRTYSKQQNEFISLC